MQSPGAWDRFAYALDNPLLYTDPTGHASKKTEKESVQQKKAKGGYGSSTPTSTPTPPPPTYPPIIPLFPTSTPTSTPGYSIGPAPTATATPETTISAPKSNGISIEFGYNTKFDKVDVLVDTIGVVGEILSWASLDPLPWGIGEVAETVGLIKNYAFDLPSKDPRNALLQQTTKQAKNALLLARWGRLVPAVGVVGNIASLYMNIRPSIKLKRK